MTAKIHQAVSFILHFLSAKRKGHGVHSPFVYSLCEEVFYNSAAFYYFSRYDRLRAALLRNDTTLDIVDHGAGSMKMKSPQRKVSGIARFGISSKKQSEILARLIHFLHCRVCIELGTSLGLNTLYMASAAGHGKIITVEGSPRLSSFASALAAKNGLANIRFVCDTFDTALPKLLETTSPDLVYIDGNHTREATLRYFEMIAAKAHNDTVIVLDDIYWSRGMTAAWRKIAGDSRVTLSIDAYHFGLVFFRKEVRDKTQLRIYV